MLQIDLKVWTRNISYFYFFSKFVGGKICCHGGAYQVLRKYKCNNIIYIIICMELEPVYIMWPCFMRAYSRKCLSTQYGGRERGLTNCVALQLNLYQIIFGYQQRQAAKWSQLVGWTNGPMYKSKEGISGFGRTDGQPENEMPPAPKGGGKMTCC